MIPHSNPYRDPDLRATDADALFVLLILAASAVTAIAIVFAMVAMVWWIGIA